MQYPDGPSQPVAEAEELISRCTAHPITHAHTWLAPAFVEEVRSVAHGMAGPTIVSSLQDGSQDRSHSLRLRKRRQHHRGIWHVLTTLVTRWYVEPTLDLFSASHSPSASSENKTQVRTTLLEATHHDSRISTMRVTRQSHESNTCPVGLWAIPNLLDGPPVAPSYALYGKSSSRVHSTSFEDTTGSPIKERNATGSRADLPTVSHSQEPTGHLFRRTQHGS
jgi:hypothetical protein